MDLFESKAVHVRNGGKDLFPALVAKAPTLDIATVGVVAVAASVLCVGTPYDHFYRDVDVLIQVLLVGALPQIESSAIALCPFACDVQAITRQAGR